MGKKELDLGVDLTSLSDADLAKFEEDAVAEFDALDGDDNASAESLERMGALADGISAAREQKTGRAAAAEEAAAKRESYRASVHATEDTDANASAEAVPAEGEGGEAVTASARPKTDVRDVLKTGDKLNSRLATATSMQPSTAKPKLSDAFDASVMVAAGNIPNRSEGSRIETMADLVDAFKSLGRVMPTTRAFQGGEMEYGTYQDHEGRNKYGALGVKGADWRSAPRSPIATMTREFKYLVDEMSSADKVFEVMQAAAAPQALVAAGGWCSPSEIRYDFYNIVGMDGAVDLPTVGIRRGGMRWPTSPSFGDLASSTGLWHWNETQDIAAATGTAQSGSKTCARIPCAAFNEARLEGEGICITAGNLSTDAWPEQLSNFLRLVNAAHFHRVNSWFLNSLVAQSTTATVGVSGQGVITPLLDSIELQVMDLRAKYAMSDNATMEAIFPNWVVGLIRADLAKRKGYDTPASSFNITNAEIAAWFTSRGISAQFVQDYQVRASGFLGQSAIATSWPLQVQYLIYPAGTFVRGNGLNLDLGIIRDSTLNATNDYTAAWSEEFFLLAKVGHESRAITVPLTANGAVGADVTYTPPVL